MTFKELKQNAKFKCKGKWKGLVGITFLFLLISISLENIVGDFASITELLLLPATTLYYTKALINFRNSNEDLYIFRSTKLSLRQIWNLCKVYFWIILYLLIAIFLFVMVSNLIGIESFFDTNFFNEILNLKGLSLIFYILLYLGVYVYISYIFIKFSLSIFLIAENDTLNCAKDFMEQSKILIKGNIWRFVFLNLSFIGWIILCILSCGIGFLWLIPYMSLTFIEFYYDLKNTKDLDHIYTIDMTHKKNHINH